MDISTFRGYYPHFVDISAFCGYYPHFVDTIHIGHIKSYLARNVIRVLRSFILDVDIIFGLIKIYLYRNVLPISHKFTRLVKFTGASL